MFRMRIISILPEFRHHIGSTVSNFIYERYPSEGGKQRTQVKCYQTEQNVQFSGLL